MNWVERRLVPPWPALVLRYPGMLHSIPRNDGGQDALPALSCWEAAEGMGSPWGLQLPLQRGHCPLHFTL